MPVTIKYNVDQLLTFKGTVEVDDDVYEELQRLEARGDSEGVGNIILDYINTDDPQDVDISDADFFKKAEDGTK